MPDLNAGVSGCSRGGADRAPRPSLRSGSGTRRSRHTQKGARILSRPHHLYCFACSMFPTCLALGSGPRLHNALAPVQPIPNPAPAEASERCHREQGWALHVSPGKAAPSKWQGEHVLGLVVLSTHASAHPSPPLGSVRMWGSRSLPEVHSLSQIGFRWLHHTGRITFTYSSSQAPSSLGRAHPDWGQWSAFSM